MVYYDNQKRIESIIKLENCLFSKVLFSLSAMLRVHSVMRHAEVNLIDFNNLNSVQLCINVDISDVMTGLFCERYLHSPSW